MVDWGDNGVELLGIGSAHLCENVRATNNVGHGIRIHSGNITRCVASSNGGTGIFATSGITIDRCTANENEVDGIVVFDGSASVIGCDASRNSFDGIHIFEGNTVVVGNTCLDNGIPTPFTGGGIVVSGDTVVQDNHLHGNVPRGIQVLGTGNTIIKNVVTGSTTNYDIAAGNDSGPIGTAAASTSPWANITD